MQKRRWFILCSKASTYMPGVQNVLRARMEKKWLPKHLNLRKNSLRDRRSGEIGGDTYERVTLWLAVLFSTQTGLCGLLSVVLFTSVKVVRHTCCRSPAFVSGVWDQHPPWPHGAVPQAFTCFSWVRFIAWRLFKGNADRTKVFLCPPHIWASSHIWSHIKKGLVSYSVLVGETDKYWDICKRNAEHTETLGSVSYTSSNHVITGVDLDACFLVGTTTAATLTFKRCQMCNINKCVCGFFFFCFICWRPVLIFSGIVNEIQMV